LDAEYRIDLRKRDRYIIIHDILSECENGARKVWLIHRVRLSYEETNKYIAELENKGLIDLKDDNKYYLTEKGEELLETLEEYRRKRKELYKIITRIVEIYNKK